ncbi:MAG: putative Ig domain-containing protein [Pseudomonadota bacterium]
MNKINVKLKLLFSIILFSIILFSIFLSSCGLDSVVLSSNNENTNISVMIKLTETPPGDIIEIIATKDELEESVSVSTIEGQINYELELTLSEFGTWSFTAYLKEALSILSQSEPLSAEIDNSEESLSLEILIENEDQSVEIVLSEDDITYDSFRISTSSLSNGTIGTSYSESLEAIGGTETGYTWSITSGSLPNGLSIDGNNNTLNWGSFSFNGNVDQSMSPDLTEISGVVASRLNPGVFWVMDDSGGGSDFYAIDGLGNILQEYQVGASNHDWEDIAIGPGPDENTEYIYIGDVGDNSETRTNYKVVRIEEPEVPATRSTSAISLSYNSFYFLYPDGSHNCETMFVDWETSIVYLVQKTSGSVKVYKFPTEMDPAWTSSFPVTLTQITSTGVPNLVYTGGDSSRDSQRIVLRDYSSIWEYARPQDGSFDDIFLAAPTYVGSVSGYQYEAVCYSSDGIDMYTYTETHTTAPIYQAMASEGPLDTTISGTPTNAGVFDFTVQVMDSSGETATRNISIVVD